MLQPWTCHCGQLNAGPAPCSRCLNPAPPFAAWGAAPEPPRRSLAVLGLSLVVAVVLVAGAVASFVMSSRDDDGGGGDLRGRTAVYSPDQQPAAGASEVERTLPELMRFVEQARGLQFKEPVKVTLLGDRAFRARLRGDDVSAQDEEDIRTTQRVLQALGLIESDVDLGSAVESLLGSAVAGFYDPEDDDLVVRGEDLTASRKVTLVHELTHALQDQHFDIEGRELDERDDESADGLTALVEGDAVRIELMYLESLPLAEQKAFETEESALGAGISPSTPRVLLELLGVPYSVGPDLVDALLGAGGQSRLDAAFGDPPTTSEQLLHPEAYLAGQGAVEVPAPRPEGDKIDEGVLGEVGLILFLREGVGSGAIAAAEGWGGDRYVAWRDGDRACVRTVIAMDTPADATELRRALDRMARQDDGLTVRGREVITVTSCG
ncbi:MAG TPA: hypothetical protein VFO65_09150 [Acidimicrobiales bacterium]|nr:hypothetical protein [Acidimicrobiales bacterium]